MTKIQFFLHQAATRLWIRPTLFSLGALGWVALSYLAEIFYPEAFAVKIPKETLVGLFTILASTMLTVATFSVSAVANAFAAVGNSASPRATSIVMADARIQSTLAAFLAAFIYAVVSITALSAVGFGDVGRFMLFLGFVLLVAWVLMSFLAWVDRVSRLGVLGDTLERVSEAARKAFAEPGLAGTLGGRSHSEDDSPPNGTVLRFDSFGYIQHVDMEALQALAEKRGAKIWLSVRPGKLVTPHAPVGVFQVAGAPDQEDLDAIRECFSTGRDRSPQTDPRFSMILLAEVAGRALSPAVNDPGTAIAVLGLQLELFHLWAENERKPPEPPRFDRISLPAITAEDLIFDAFTPAARDGAGSIEVCMRLQKGLRALMHMNYPPLRDAASAYRESALELSDQALPARSQRDAVRKLARKDLEDFDREG